MYKGINAHGVQTINLGGSDYSLDFRFRAIEEFELHIGTTWQEYASRHLEGIQKLANEEPHVFPIGIGTIAHLYHAGMRFTLGERRPSIDEIGDKIQRDGIGNHATAAAIIIFNVLRGANTGPEEKSEGKPAKRRRKQAR